MKKKIRMILAIIIIALGIPIFCNAYEVDYSINLNDLSNIKTYATEEELKTAESIEEVYITNFLYDGVSAVKDYDLDDYIEANSNDIEVKKIDIKVINIHKAGNIEITGNIKGGMIAINTNGIAGNLNIYLKDVSIDTDSKKMPAIYVYNKDINYADCKVTIIPVENSKNYIEGGRLKKVSLMPKEALESYASYYTNDNLTNYNTYSNYYGIYTTEEMANILFATVKADQEKLMDGDPYFYYKAAGAISSDIDIYFEGKGKLEVKSKNKEGIEGKGNIQLIGKTGEYIINSYDDCINTTTDENSSITSVYKNDILINVKSLIAIVDSGEDSDEGDAIDSNGMLTIDGGNILAIAHPGQDSGLDSNKGIYINGGTIIATGDMYDEIKNVSRQQFIALNFAGIEQAETIVVIQDSEEQNIMAYKSDRPFSSLVYSSDKLKDETYKVFVNGKMEGKETNGIYENITSYAGGAKQQWTSIGNMGMGPKGGPGQRQNTAKGSTDFTLSTDTHVFSGVSNESALDDIVKTSTTGLTITEKQVIAIASIIVIILLMIAFTLIFRKKK